MSWVVSPNDRTTDPAKVAASARLTSNEADKSNIAGVAFSISCIVKPNFANSVCNETTCEAVKAVVDPNSFAWSDNTLSSSDVLPVIAPSPEMAFENSAPFLPAFVNKVIKEAKAITTRPIPEAANEAVKACKAGTALNIANLAALKPAAIPPPAAAPWTPVFLILVPSLSTAFPPVILVCTSTTWVVYAISIYLISRLIHF